MTRVPWALNDELFLQECRTGHFWERHVASFLAQQGLCVELGEQLLREHISQASAYIDTIDLLCEGVPVEVKSRSLTFHTPADVPFVDVFVDTQKGWDAKTIVPAHVLCISQNTGAMIYLDVEETRDRWVSRSAYDRVRDFTDVFYYADRKLWHPIEHFVRKVRFSRPSACPVLGVDV